MTNLTRSQLVRTKTAVDLQAGRVRMKAQTEGSKALHRLSDDWDQLSVALEAILAEVDSRGRAVVDIKGDQS
jgi:hypothetical protein